MVYIICCCRRKRKRRRLPPIVLIGTQSDLREDVKTLVSLADAREAPVSEAEARRAAERLGCQTYIESSSLTQRNLKEVFDEAIVAGLRGRHEKEVAAAKDRARAEAAASGGTGCRCVIM